MSQTIVLLMAVGFLVLQICTRARKDFLQCTVSGHTLGAGKRTSIPRNRDPKIEQLLREPVQRRY
jgi:hypothetical protein